MTNVKERSLKMVTSSLSTGGSSASNPPPQIHIRPTKGWVALDLNELWNFRSLLYFLIWRDIKIRYKQTVMGVGWAILQPLIAMLIFTIFFGRLAKMPSDGIPYPIFAYTALVPWMFFANALTLASNSLVMQAQMIKKIYFPRLFLPVASVLAGVVDFVLAFIILLAFMGYYGFLPTINVLWLPLLLVLALMTSLGVSLWLSAMNVQFRDVRYIIPFLTQIWFFATPIVYPSSLVPEQWRFVHALNPMVGVIEGFRWILLDAGPAPGPSILVSVAVAIFLFVTGLFYFRRLEKTFADVS